jgi:G3E family GTPase
MRLLLITGFLGSGKTTLIIKLAQAATARAKRVAIVVNEIGEIGIDDRLMRQLELNVWELVNGCICCTLSGDLVTTLQKLDANYAPDLVIVEPSGAADPKNILSALPYYRGRPLEGLYTATIVDPLRVQMLVEVLTPLITSQIQHADLILISKRDLASPAEIEAARQAAQEHNPGARVMTIDAQHQLEPDVIAELVP